MRRQHANSTAGAPNGKSGFNTQCLCGFRRDFGLEGAWMLRVLILNFNFVVKIRYLHCGQRMSFVTLSRQWRR
ncbi:MAG: hypothetical protein H7252_08325 [Cytophaga sp.]|nr:hypothetical protein [Undibacterium sp.]